SASRTAPGLRPGRCAISSARSPTAPDRTRSSRRRSKPSPHSSDRAPSPAPQRRTVMAADTTRTVRAPRGPERTAKSWGAEAAKRMLMNNLDPDVAEHPEDLVVYGGTGRAARSWAAYDAIVRTLDELEPDETLLVQSGKPVGVF